MKRRLVTWMAWMLVASATLLTPMTAYAGNEAVIPTKVREYAGEELVTSQAGTRSLNGSLISSVGIEMTDLGGGRIEAYGDIMCHTEMRKLSIWLHLDQWNEENENWEQKETFKFEWKKEDYPDENLSMAMVSVEIPITERGRYYRVRGIYGAFEPEPESRSEVMAAKTDGMYIE